MDTFVKDDEYLYVSLDDIRAIVRKKKYSYILLKDGHSVSIATARVDKVIQHWTKVNKAEIKNIEKEESGYMDSNSYPISKENLLSRKKATKRNSISKAKK